MAAAAEAEAEASQTKVFSPLPAPAAEEGAAVPSSPRGSQEAANEAAAAAAAAAALEAVGPMEQPAVRRGGEPKQPSAPGTPASPFEYTGDFTGEYSALTNPDPDH